MHAAGARPRPAVQCTYTRLPATHVRNATQISMRMRCRTQAPQQACINQFYLPDSALPGFQWNVCFKSVAYMHGAVSRAGSPFAPALAASAIRLTAAGSVCRRLCGSKSTVCAGIGIAFTHWKGFPCLHVQMCLLHLELHAILTAHNLAESQGHSFAGR